MKGITLVIYPRNKNVLFGCLLVVISFVDGLLRQNPRANAANSTAEADFRRLNGNGKRIQHLYATGLRHL